ncbi:MAG TPA: ABATE domain-containing protein [Nitrospira sp.]|nr:ABATE domain-containing protein [Nitrospira sp.]
METSKRDMPFLFVGNHACLDFINTALVVDGQPRDLLATYSQVIAWAVESKLLTQAEADAIEEPSGKQANAAERLEQIRDFRSMLRDMVERIAAGKAVPQAAVHAINDALRVRVGYPELVSRKGKFEQKYHTERAGGAHLLGVLAESAADLLSTCDLSLIKKCQNPACVLFFYDTTKNHARHWCSMTLCGNRHKVAAHYRRHRKGRA